jgi:hypothetical protein
MSNRQVTYTLKLNSNVSGILNQADKDALHLDSTMWQVQKTMAAFGVGLGANYLIDAAKNWTQGAADYEMAMLRIKNASDNAITGIRNGFFINKEVDDFKIKLEETIQAYGGFLFKIKNAHLSTGQKNTLFDDILTVSKASGIPLSEMESTIRNTSVMLGEGVLEARHLRGLSYTHPQLVPFIAQELGLKDNDMSLFNSLMHAKSADENDITKEQQLSRLISSGKLTKAAIPAETIVEAYHKYAESVKKLIPETLETVESEINTLGNTWDRFKNKMILDEKGELVTFFHELTGGVHWLVEHQEQLMSIGSSIVKIALAYGTWRLAILALQAPLGIMQFFGSEQQRLNLLIERYSTLAEQNVIINQQLVASQSQVAESSNIQSISETRAVSNAEANIVAIQSQIAELTNLSAALAQESIQMDLFTEAQIQNNAISQESILIYGVEANAIRTLNELEVIQLELFETQALALSQNMVQHSLFTESELEMASAVTFTSDALALQNEQLALQNKLLIEQAELNEVAALNTASAMAGNSRVLNPYSGMFNASSVSSLVSSVFIVGMAAELINGFLPKGNWSGNKIELSDWGYGVSQLVSPYAWFNGMGKSDNIGFGKAINQGVENGLIETFKEDFKKAFPVKYDIYGKTLNPYVNPKGSEFYDLINQIQSLHPEYDFIKNLGIKPDNFGKMHTSNSELYSILQQHSVPLPYLGDEKNWDSFGPWVSSEAKDIAMKKDYSINANKFGKDSNKLKGNSSNYITININEMNGVKSYKVTKNSNTDLTEEKIAAIAGDAILKMMIDEINDSQQLRK